MIGKEAWKEYKKDFGTKSTLTAMYVFILAVCLILNIWAGFTMVITIPFFVLPFTFAYLSTLAGLKISKAAPIKSFFVFYPLYFQSIFFGGFKALIGFLKAILISVIFSTLLTIILYYTFLRGQPGFAEILKEIELANDVKSMTVAMDHFWAFEPANLTMKISSLVGSFFATYAFIRHCLLNSEKFYINLMTNKPMPMKAVSRLYMVAAHMRRKEFYKEYYGAVWYVALWFLLTFGGATYVAGFVFNFDATRTLFVALFVSLILLLPFIPYYFDVLRMIFIASTDDYSKASIHLSEKTLDDLQRRNQLSEEDRKKIEEEIQRSKKELDKMIKEADDAIKENPEQPSEDKK